jgi:CRISPR-associated protein Csx14
MTHKPTFTVNVDVTNPGQFFACCGLLELSHRLWPEAEGSFSEDGKAFTISSPNDESATVDQLREAIVQCDITGLTQADREEREALEAEKKQLKRQGKELSGDKETRRKELGTMARAGALSLRTPFNLLLNWWQTSDDDNVKTPKTWAGLQEIHKVARAAQDAIGTIADLTELLNHSCVLVMPNEYRKSEGDEKKTVEPFYFDARRFAHALDVGFSLDIQGAETAAYPAVELLALIGLQRFRPGAFNEKWWFEYTTWVWPINAPIAAAVVSGAVPLQPERRYRFRLLFRDDQKRYKAFSYATQTGGERND